MWLRVKLVTFDFVQHEWKGPCSLLKKSGPPNDTPREYALKAHGCQHRLDSQMFERMYIRLLSLTRELLPLALSQRQAIFPVGLSHSRTIVLSLQKNQLSRQVLLEPIVSHVLAELLKEIFVSPTWRWSMFSSPRIGLFQTQSKFYLVITIPCNFFSKENH